MEYLHKILFFLFALGVLVTAHEYGHFWVARRLGVKVLRFSIGFGRPLARWRSGETEVTVSAIPLGGYVRMLDEREGEVAPEELPRAFNRQPLATRAAVVAAGPLANFLLAILAYWVMLMIGVTGPRAIIGEISADSPAARAGLHPGDEIVQVEARPTQTWDGVLRAALDGVLDQRGVKLVVQDGNGAERPITLEVGGIGIDEVGSGDFFKLLGMAPKGPVLEPVVGELTRGGVAEAAGMRSGDRIVAVDDQPIPGWSEWVTIVRGHPGTALRVRVERADGAVDLVLTPAREQDRGQVIGRIGAAPRPPVGGVVVPMGVERYGVIDAFTGAFDRTRELTATTLKFLGKMVTAQASLNNLSGPISIAHYAGESAKLGPARFLEFLALVSVSLAVLNLLPIPILDGGHLLFYLIEFAARRPVPEQLQAAAQQAGMVVLLGLMGLAVYFDLHRFL